MLFLLSSYRVAPLKKAVKGTRQGASK